MKTELKSFEQLALKAILSGKTWNGKFYDYRGGKTFIYVGGDKFQVVNKELFQSELNHRAAGGFAINGSRDIRNLNKYGYDAIEK